MFEITPKEQLLKNIRKGLVQPLSNRFPLLNFDKNLVRSGFVRTDESFVKAWVNEGFLFSVYNGYNDLILQIRDLCVNYNLGLPAVEDPALKNLMNETQVPHVPADQADATLVSGFSKLEIGTNTLYFSSEIHPIRAFHNTGNLILFGKSSQVEHPNHNKYFSEIALKSDFRVQLTIDYFKRFRSVFLFIEEK